MSLSCQQYRGFTVKLAIPITYILKLIVNMDTKRIKKVSVNTVIVERQHHHTCNCESRSLGVFIWLETFAIFSSSVKVLRRPINTVKRELKNTQNIKRSFSKENKSNAQSFTTFFSLFQTRA